MLAARKVTPIRGSSLELEHIVGCEGAAPSTVKKIHDRGQFLPVKSLLAKNNGHQGELRQHYHLSETYSGPTAVGVSRHFKEPVSCFEVMEAVHNYMAVQWSIR